jgi:glycosyltransferase involved in cell wall biosynthesis
MIAFDVTKATAVRHHSGLQRVSNRLRSELAALAPGETLEVAWVARDRGWRRVGGPRGERWTPAAGDWWFTPELFSEEERPGLGAWLAARTVRTAAVYYDAIPLQHPAITWPHSVRRHPGYLKLLAGCDRVFAISAASRDELLEWWRWAGVAVRAVVEVLPLGADADSAPRTTDRVPRSGRPGILCLGILEPRKRQTLLVEACAPLWAEGLDFELHFVGRVNPHFGRAIERSLRAAARVNPRLHWHGTLGDAALAALFDRVDLVAVPSLAEGNGLPVVEALWRGLPVVCSDRPALCEHARGGGCVVVSDDTAAGWTAALRSLVSDATVRAELTAAAGARPLPTWRAAAGELRRLLGAAGPAGA